MKRLIQSVQKRGFTSSCDIVQSKLLKQENVQEIELFTLLCEIKKWFKDEYHIIIEPQFNTDLYRRLHAKSTGKKALDYRFIIYTNVNDEPAHFYSFYSDNTYKTETESLIGGLKQAVKHIINQI